MRNIHIHTGPGHHEGILMNELRKHEMSFSYSLYYPCYEYGISDKGGELSALAKSHQYDIVNRWVWRFKRAIPYLGNSKNYQDITYPLFDKITSKKLNGNTLLFGWSQMSLHCIRKVKSEGGISILEYPIAHVESWRQHLLEECKRYNISAKHSFFSSRMFDRMRKEIALADFISIPSTFVKNTFLENGVSEDKLIVNPYGIDSNYFTPCQKKPDDIFTVIAVGSVEVRKGFQYLLRAFDELDLPEAELKIIGKINSHFQSIKKQYSKNPAIKFLGDLNRENTAQEMKQADVMVMPSLVEGLSLVILETMASGTPVISSEHAGGLDVIDDDQDGFIVPVRDIESLKEKIDWCYSHRDRLVGMGKLARKKIEDCYTIEKYGSRAASNLNRFLKTTEYASER